MSWLEHLRALERHHTSGSRSGLEYNTVFRLLNAADYGVPQQRQRVLIVGFRSDIGASWSFPEPTHSRAALEHAKHGDGSYWEEHRVPRSARPEPPQGAGRRQPGSLDEGEPTLRWQTVRDALAGLPEPGAPGFEAFANHEHRAGARPYAGHSGSVLDEPSKTIKAGAHGVPGGENMVRLDDGTLRYYSVRESARIQTFPDAYVFPGSWTESMRQIGNAVPVRLARIIGESLARELERVEGSDGDRRQGRTKAV